MLTLYVTCTIILTVKQYSAFNICILLIPFRNIMSLSKLSSTDVHLFNMRLQKAQNTQFALNECNFSNNLLKVLNGHANAIGVPQEFILWPLLTATASFMGTNAFVKINEEWWEPSII